MLEIKSFELAMGFEPTFDAIAAPITDKGLENLLGYASILFLLSAKATLY
jgi:hypothetical protein